MSRGSKNIKVYPTSERDRHAFWSGIGLVSIAVLIYLFTPHSFMRYLLAVMVFSLAIINFLLPYAVQDRQEPVEGSEYAQMIGQLDETGKVLTTLSAFLEQERLRVNQAEQTVSRL